MIQRPPAARRAPLACLLVLPLAMVVVPALGCAGSRANATNRATNTGGTNAQTSPGATTDSGSRMLDFGDPVGSITVETPPMQGSSADAPLPPPLPPGHSVAPPMMPERRSPPRPPAPSWPPPNNSNNTPAPPPGNPADSSGLGAPPVPAPEVRRTP